MKLDSLPLFPLEIVLYPDESLSLHIFEERYRDLVTDCRTWEAPFGVVLTRGGKLEQVGCTARITGVPVEYEDGRSDIEVCGEQRFRIIQVRHERTYLTADIETLQPPGSVPDSRLHERVIAQHIKLLELAGRTPRPTAYQDRDPLSFFIAHNAGLSLEQKQHVLELDRENDRIVFLVEHLEKFIPAVEEAESVRKKVRSNGHFKDFPAQEND